MLSLLFSKGQIEDEEKEMDPNLDLITINAQEIEYIVHSPPPDGERRLGPEGYRMYPPGATGAGPGATGGGATGGGATVAGATVAGATVAGATGANAMPEHMHDWDQRCLSLTTIGLIPHHTSSRTKFPRLCIST